MLFARVVLTPGLFARCLFRLLSVVLASCFLPWWVLLVFVCVLTLFFIRGMCFGFCSLSSPLHVFCVTFNTGHETKSVPLLESSTHKNLSLKLNTQLQGFQTMPPFFPVFTSKHASSSQCFVTFPNPPLKLVLPSLAPQPPPPLPFSSQALHSPISSLSPKQSPIGPTAPLLHH